MACRPQLQTCPTAKDFWFFKFDCCHVVQSTSVAGGIAEYHGSTSDFEKIFKNVIIAHATVEAVRLLNAG